MPSPGNGNRDAGHRPGGSESLAAGGRTALRGALVTSLWTAGSRVLGFLRDALMAAFFGVTPVTGAFALAWVVPNLFRRLFGEGAVGAAVLPALARAREEAGEDAARGLFARFHGFLLLLLLALTAGGEGLLLSVLAARPPGSGRWTLELAAILLPYVVPICLTALLAAPQHQSGRFLLPALAPALLNLVWISTLLGLRFSSEEPALGLGDARRLCLALVAGGLLQWLLQAPGLRAAGYPLRPAFRPGDGRVRRALRSFFPALLGLAVVQVHLALDQVLVQMLVDEAANTYTWLANRLLQLPLALVGIAAATGTLPLFARLSAQGRYEELGRSAARTLESTLLLILAAAAGLFVLALPVVTVLFEHGAFTPGDSEVLARTLRAYLWGLPFAAAAGILTRLRQARGDYRGPAWIAGAVVPVNLVLDLLLLEPDFVEGAGYATSAALALQALLLLRGLPGLGIRLPLRPLRLLRLALPAAAALAAAGGAAALLASAAATPAGLALAVLAGLGASLGSAARLFPAEWRELRAGLGRSGKGDRRPSPGEDRRQGESGDP